jgi:lysophospholipid acyltransferase (LPLAT)-like uncharacterized protein
MQLPLPFARVVFVLSEPLAVGEAEGEGARQPIEDALARAHAAAAAAVRAPVA